MTHGRELIASAQMRDRIAAMLEYEADSRDRRRAGHDADQMGGKARLLHAMARKVRGFPASIAHGDGPAPAVTPPEMQELIRKVTA